MGIASQAIGIGLSRFEESLEYAKTREQFLANLFPPFRPSSGSWPTWPTELDAAELLTLKAAWLEDRHLLDEAVAMVKMFASDAAMRASIEGVQILGYGYCWEYPMERHMRDA